MSDHVFRPGPGYWEWRCLDCSEAMTEHDHWWVAAWRRLTRWAR